MNQVFYLICVRVTCIFCHLTLILGVLYCPTMHQWESRAIVRCPDPSTYHCLLNEEDQYTEVCVKAVYVSKGKYPMITRNATIITTSCPIDEYQPTGKFSNRYRKTTCDFRKSTCNDAGETTCNNGSAISDRLCECDYWGGYRNFQTERCYKKSTSSPYYQCVDECLFRLPRNYSCIADKTGKTAYRMKERPQRTPRVGQLKGENYKNNQRFPAKSTLNSEHVTSGPERSISTKNKAILVSTSLSPRSSSLSESLSETDSTIIENAHMTLIDSNEGTASAKDAIIVVLLVSLVVVLLIACNQRKKRLTLMNHMAVKGPDVCLYPDNYQTIFSKGENVTYQTVNFAELSDEVRIGVDFTESHDTGNSHESPVNRNLDVMDTEYVEMRNITVVSGRTVETPNQT